MQKHTVAIIGLGRMGSTIDDDEGHGDVPYSVASATRASARGWNSWPERTSCRISAMRFKAAGKQPCTRTSAI